MIRVTASNLVSAINRLPKNVYYNYVNPKTKGIISIAGVDLPEGPIRIKRWKPAKGESIETATEESISTEMIWRIANAVREGELLNFERILGSSYNTRSVLEALLAHTPEFYYCYPGRVEEIGGVSKIKTGHKHLMYLPDTPHQEGIIKEKEVDGMAVSEIPLQSVTYDNITVPTELVTGDIDIDVVRRHTQIQIALYLIGLQLGYRTWIAQNDKGIKYENIPLVEREGIIPEISRDDNMIAPFSEATKKAQFIDCIWFQNDKFMPAVMEVEHSTGVTSGLTRMKKLQDAIPSIQTRYVIVAHDELREKVVREASTEQFRSLDARYFSYSSVEELLYLCKKRKLRGVTQEFLDCFMEKACI